MSGYEYPDRGDRLTVRMIEEEEPYDGYWERSEEEVLDHAEDFIPRDALKVLDLGCGKGRMLERFSGYADMIVGLEPDESRMQEARKRGDDLDVEIEFVSEGFLEADTGQDFDLVVCSHIIQHVDTAELDDFVEKMHSILADGGKLVLTTSHSTRDTEFFVKSYLEEDELHEEEISEEEFNSLITNEENVLPVHLFPRSGLEELLECFKIQGFRVFHELHDRTFLDDLVFRDRWINLPVLRRKFGRDMLVVAQKKDLN